jgi:hypothetical protein
VESKGVVMDTITQSVRILRAIKKSGRKGIENFKLATYSLKYSSRIAELRQDGYNIVAERQWLNGRATGTWRYYLIEETERMRQKNQRKFLGFKKG